MKFIKLLIDEETIKVNKHMKEYQTSLEMRKNYQISEMPLFTPKIGKRLIPTI